MKKSDSADESAQDKNGSEKMKSKGKLDHSKMNEYLSTYILREWDDKVLNYFPIENLWRYDLDELEIELGKAQIKVVELFKLKNLNFESPEFQMHFNLKEKFHYCLKDVLNFHNYGTSIETRRIVLKVDLQKEIETFIAENSLEKVHNFIYLLIAEIQQKYIDDIEFWDTSEKRKMINNAQLEANKLIEAIDRIKPEFDDEKLNNLKLKHISFVFPDINPIKIENEWLNDMIVDSVKKEFNRGAYKNWKKELKLWGRRFQDYEEHLNFRYYISQAIHSFFQDQKLFKTKENTKVSNKELLCIAKILEFGLIKIGNEGISDSQKIKNVRNYLKEERKELETTPIHLPIEISLEFLLEFFDSDFLLNTPLTIPVDTITLAHGICERFEMQYLVKEIAHIITCLKLKLLQIDWQFSSSAVSKTTPNIKAFRELNQIISEKGEKKKLAELSFKIEGSPNHQILTDRLPLHIIERAIAEYYENHKEEFEVDLVKTTALNVPEKASFKIHSSDIFQEPENRFFIRFSYQMYQFIFKVETENKKEKIDTNNFSLIIAIIFQKCWLFGHQMDDEHTIHQKVKQWLKDYKSNS
jgi:hypothetical protein